MTKTHVKYCLEQSIIFMILKLVWYPAFLKREGKIRWIRLMYCSCGLKEVNEKGYDQCS